MDSEHILIVKHNLANLKSHRVCTWNNSQFKYIKNYARHVKYDSLKNIESRFENLIISFYDIRLYRE